MNHSSHTDMKQAFDYLANINKVEPSEYLYSQTLNRLNRHNVISLYWVKVVACLLILFISSELYMILNKKSNQHDITNFVSITNNILYNE